jgi:hypothetical protein
MSGLIPVGLSILDALTQGLIGPIVIQGRSIDDFVADVTVREDHEDELVVTENPVEQGADITDHSYKSPARLTVDVGYSNSSIQANGDPNYVQSIYTQFLALQASRQPFDVTTGKRQYNNMLITMLHTVTDEVTENALLLTVRMKEVILVDTQTVSVPSTANMANPSSNGATQSTGTQQPQYAGGLAGFAGSPTTSAFNYSNAPFSAGFGQGG